MQTVNDMKLVNRPLYAQAREEILKIVDEMQGFMSKLPSEQELSNRLGVSRNTIREALKSLENEGVLTSRHGVGTFVLHNTKSMKHNIAVLNSTTTIIESQGFVPGTQDVCFDRRTIQTPVVRHLGGEFSMEVLYVERVRTANGTPMIFVEDYIPYADGMLEDYNNFKDKGLFTFLELFGHQVSFSTCSIDAVLSDERLMNRLALKSPKALLKLQQTHFTTKGIAVLYSDSYFLTDELDFNLVRKCVE